MFIKITLCLSVPGVPPKNAIRTTIEGALEDMRTMQKDLGGSSGSLLDKKMNKNQLVSINTHNAARKYSSNLCTEEN